MKVSVRFFAALRDETGLERQDVELEEGSGVRDLLMALRKAYPALRGADRLLFAVNGVRSTPDQRLREGDIIVLIPPVSGG